MTLDIAMGGSTNTVLHLLAVAYEAQVKFTMDDIDALSKHTPCLCKVAPNTPTFHIQDVHRAGGVLGIMAELNKAKLLYADVKRVDGMTLQQAIHTYNVTQPTVSQKVILLYRSAPANVFNLNMGSQATYYDTTDTDREQGCIRDISHAYSTDGGLAVLKGNIATDGCVVKTAGVDQSVLTFTGTANVFHSQDDACDAILNGCVQAGDVVVIIYEGPRGGPGMQEMLYPTSYLKAKNLGKKCALITDGRFSGGTSGLSIGHVSPEAAAKGNIALLQNGDVIDIDITQRSVNVRLTDAQLQQRRITEEAKQDDAWKPVRNRNVPKSLMAYAKHVASADKGGVRIV
jgi:dihydroxy-acid dehydratase